jgi:hypothetical protein
VKKQIDRPIFLTMNADLSLRIFSRRIYCTCLGWHAPQSMRHACIISSVLTPSAQVGLLPPFNYQQVPFAYHMYQRNDKEGWEMSNGFKQAFSIDVEIHFMGLFDTVNSVGQYYYISV